MRIGSLCSGAGGLDLAVLAVLGGEVAWHADNDPAAGKVLAHHWPGVPNHGDITATDWTTVEPVDVVTAGYPCQPDSAAGLRKGKDDDRWIWPAVRDAVRDLGPGLVVLENVRGHLGRGIPAVVGDLADIGYDARWCCVPASAVGAPHRRERLFVLAHPADPPNDGREGRGCSRDRRAGPAHCGLVAADAQGVGRREGRAEPKGQFRRPDDALSGVAAADAGGPGLEVGRLQHHGPQRAAAERGGAEPASDTHGGPVREQPVPVTGSGSPAGFGLDRGAAADAAGDGLVRDPGSAGRGEACGGGERVAGGGDRGAPAAADPGGSGRREAVGDLRQRESDPEGRTDAQWGRWAPAIRRWERLTRPAPDPVELGRRGNRRLNPAFSEWMMGLPAGWVTAVPGLSRNDQLRLIGNGVVPQQGVAALRWLLGSVPGPAGRPAPRPRRPCAG